MLFQALSTRLGIVTGRNLAEWCRIHFPTPLVSGCRSSVMSQALFALGAHWRSHACVGVDATRARILSQVALSLTLPVPVLARSSQPTLEHDALSLLCSSRL
ncbi:hypothetical protein [Thiobacillus sp.]|jgi:Mn2+/Fe2+ NRAMP family transporter|uniref:hypothetical protein n=1 Tax=Thiobacillus sp. TaxID=924 RepID=UPI003917FE3F